MVTVQTTQSIAAMTRDEAQQHVLAVKGAAVDIGRRLLDLKAREGWRALGYATWTAFLEGEFSYSRKHLYELMRAAPIQEQFVTSGYTLSSKAAAALAQFPEDLRPAIVQIAWAEAGALGKPLNAGLIERTGEVLVQAARTGVVDVNGEATPFSAALIEEEAEALKRQKQYIRDNAAVSSKSALRKLTELNVLFEHRQGAQITFSTGFVPDTLKPNTPYILRIYEELDDERA